MEIPNNVIVMKDSDNILNSGAEWLVCPTNAVGTMGAGLAKYFSLSIPYLVDAYKKHCRSHEPIKMEHFVFERKGQPKVYCFHTKCDWREYSNLRTIESGLNKLAEWVLTNKVSSIAIPALGCGKGQLAWDEVLPLLLKFAVKVSETTVTIYPPKL